MIDKPYGITLDPASSLANRTGTWRVERPVYVDHLAPCNRACPAGQDIQRWLYAAEEGAYELAWRTLVADNPLPAITGRVCYRPCEAACNRARLDDAVGIGSVERFLGDLAIERGWTTGSGAAETGRRVLVVGAGPSGLSAAYHLRRLGHDVTVREAADAAGGMLRYGIPAYRLPRDVLDAEVRRITAMGVRLEFGRAVNDIEAEMRDGGCDAAFVAVGAHVGRHAEIPAGDAARILDAVSLLRTVDGEQPPQLGRHVVVYGGGNTALDAARTARRLGATDAVVVYRRTRARMPAHAEEVEDALAEGVRMKWLSTIAAAGAGTVRVEHMRLDDTGFPQPTGEFEDLDADSVILALGQDAELSLLDGVAGVTAGGGVVEVDTAMMTGRPGIFAGGDAVRDERTVTVAIGHGKRAARSIDAWLRGEVASTAAERPLAAFESLNTWYYADAPRTLQPQLAMIRRRSTFDEVRGGLDEATALFEARRCLSCGNCFECDNCYAVCPDNAVVKLGPGQRYAIDDDFCKGCGLCAAECPCGAIEMVAETI